MAIELTPNWKPLESRLPPEHCCEFMWMFRENGIEHYKHAMTRRYLRLDTAGRCLAWISERLTEVHFEDEWKRVSGRA